MLMMEKKKTGGVIVGVPASKEGSESGDALLHACVEEFIASVKAGDVGGAVQAFKACFSHLESMPHEESSDRDY